MTRTSGRALPAAVTGAVVVVATGVWAVGLGLVIDEDYCFTRMTPPVVDGRAAGWSGPEWKPPLWVECDYVGVGSRTKREWAPLVWSGAVLAVTGFLVAATWWTARIVRRRQPAR